MAQIKHISLWEEGIDKVQFPKLTHHLLKRQL